MNNNNQEETPGETVELSNYRFVYTFTQTITGYAAAPSEESLTEAVLDNWGGMDDFRIISIEKLTQEQMDALHERLSGEEVLN